MKPREYSQRLHVTTVNKHGETRGHYLTNVETIGTVLRSLRETGRELVTQTELARKLGTSQSTISQLEDFTYTGTSITTLRKVADALGYDVSIVLTQRDS